MLDLRVPSGWFFAALGVILLFWGVVYPNDRAPLADINVNLYSGIAMLVFGGFLLALAWRRQPDKPAGHTHS
jgi:hypothetical protein